MDSPTAAQLGVGFAASAVTEDGVLIAGARPTEWLLIGDREPVAALVAGLDRSGHVGVVDHTHSRALLRLVGGDAAALLELVCNLDWSDRMTPNGAVVSASVAKVTCDIIRQDVPAAGGNGEGGGAVRSYRLACDRSFAQYLFDVLLDVGAEFGIRRQV